MFFRNKIQNSDELTHKLVYPIHMFDETQIQLNFLVFSSTKVESSLLVCRWMDNRKFGYQEKSRQARQMLYNNVHRGLSMVEYIANVYKISKRKEKL